MKASLLNKLDILQDRFEELTALLGDGEVISDQNKFRTYSKEYAEVEPIVGTYKQLLKVQGDLEGAQALLKDSDPDMREMAVEEVREAKEQLIELEASLQRMLLPKDPNDGRNVFLEIRAGTGGDEAAISPATCSACIRDTPSVVAGGWKFFPRTRENTVAIKKSSPGSKATTFTAS